MKNSMMFFTCLIIQVILFKIGDCSIVKNSWRPVPVSNASLQDPSVKTEEIYSVSDLTCSIAATKSRWANLFCYKDDRCSLYDFLAVPALNDSLISDPVNCMTKITGCVFGQKNYEINEMVNVAEDSNECPMCFANNQLLNAEFLPPNQIFSTCEEPFKQTSIGCLRAYFAAVDYCSAVNECRLVGGTLASLDTISHRNELPALADEIGGPIATNQAFFAGVKRNGTESAYVFTGSKTILDDQSPLWTLTGTTFPTAKRYDCVIVYFRSGGGTRDYYCDYKTNFVCERKIK